MITIDEAIAHEREAAERNRTLADSDELIQKSYDAYFNIKKCVKCAEEHEQLAEWLEELKAYREIGTVEECMNSVLDIQKAYNKAIDDFKKALFKNSERARPVGWLGYSEIVTCEKIYDIAEQLKAGGENE